ncbi:MAG: hypothetical protein N3A54_03310 [Patescibacteria group bacterium]|nr:hypothetical protein [Patescibacteria group bacterium]
MDVIKNTFLTDYSTNGTQVTFEAFKKINFSKLLSCPIPALSLLGSYSIVVGKGATAEGNTLDYKIFYKAKDKEISLSSLIASEREQMGGLSYEEMVNLITQNPQEERKNIKYLQGQTIEKTLFNISIEEIILFWTYVYFQNEESVSSLMHKDSVAKFYAQYKESFQQQEPADEKNKYTTFLKAYLQNFSEIKGRPSNFVNRLFFSAVNNFTFTVFDRYMKKNWSVEAQKLQQENQFYSHRKGQYESIKNYYDSYKNLELEAINGANISRYKRKLNNKKLGEMVDFLLTTQKEINSLLTPYYAFVYPFLSNQKGYTNDSEEIKNALLSYYENIEKVPSELKNYIGTTTIERSVETLPLSEAIPHIFDGVQNVPQEYQKYLDSNEANKEVVDDIFRSLYKTIARVPREKAYIIKKKPYIPPEKLKNIPNFIQFTDKGLVVGPNGQFEQITKDLLNLFFSYNYIFGITLNILRDKDYNNNILKNINTIIQKITTRFTYAVIFEMVEEIKSSHSTAKTQAEKDQEAAITSASIEEGFKEIKPSNIVGKMREKGYISNQTIPLLLKLWPELVKRNIQFTTNDSGNKAQKYFTEEFIKKYYDKTKIGQHETTGNILRAIEKEHFSSLLSPDDEQNVRYYLAADLCRADFWAFVSRALLSSNITLKLHSNKQTEEVKLQTTSQYVNATPKALKITRANVFFFTEEEINEHQIPSEKIKNNQTNLTLKEKLYNSIKRKYLLLKELDKGGSYYSPDDDYNTYAQEEEWGNPSTETTKNPTIYNSDLDYEEFEQEDYNNIEYEDFVSDLTPQQQPKMSATPTQLPQQQQGQISNVFNQTQQANIKDIDEENIDEILANDQELRQIEQQKAKEKEEVNQKLRELAKKYKDSYNSDFCISFYVRFGKDLISLANILPETAKLFSRFANSAYVYEAIELGSMQMPNYAKAFELTKQKFTIDSQNPYAIKTKIKIDYDSAVKKQTSPLLKFKQEQFKATQTRAEQMARNFLDWNLGKIKTPFPITLISNPIQGVEFIIYFTAYRPFEDPETGETFETVFFQGGGQTNPGSHSYAFDKGNREKTSGFSLENFYMKIQVDLDPNYFNSKYKFRDEIYSKELCALFPGVEYKSDEENKVKSAVMPMMITPKTIYGNEKIKETYVFQNLMKNNVFLDENKLKNLIMSIFQKKIFTPSSQKGASATSLGGFVIRYMENKLRKTMAQKIKDMEARKEQELQQRMANLPFALKFKGQTGEPDIFDQQLKASRKGQEEPGSSFVPKTRWNPGGMVRPSTPQSGGPQTKK